MSAPRHHLTFAQQLEIIQFYHRNKDDLGSDELSNSSPRTRKAELMINLLMALLTKAKSVSHLTETDNFIRPINEHEEGVYCIIIRVPDLDLESD